MTLITRLFFSQFNSSKSILYNRIVSNQSKLLRPISFLSGSNATYVEDLYIQWKKDSSSVHKSWDLFFQAADRGVDLAKYYTPVPSISFGHGLESLSPSKTQSNINSESLLITASFSEHLSVNNLIQAYQNLGHHVADIDPLSGEFDLLRKIPPELDPSFWGLNESHLSKRYSLPDSTFIGNDRKELTLGEIISLLKSVYTSSIGVELSHIDDAEKVTFVRQRLESQRKLLSSDDKIRILNRIIRTTTFENFLAKKYPSEKRFGIEGCDVLVSSLKDVIDKSAEQGVECFFIGMAHRGRLNVLANVCRQPLKHIFTRFRDELGLEEGGGSSDVKYHLGLSRLHKNSKHQKDVIVGVVANPSHLEAVNPVAKGKVKAEQFLRGDITGDKVMCILIHGDAAVSGQGIVYETVNLSDLPNYKVHGTIHVVINNQIGFTTNPHLSRSPRYCTDIAKIVQAPIFHVNADDPEAVSLVSSIASDYRNTFKKDVFIDLIGYRRNGHNEGDNPGFTQHQLYQKISQKPPLMTLYSNKLIDEGLISKAEYQEMVSSYEKILDNSFSEAQDASVVETKVWIDSPWKNFFPATKSFKSKPTGVLKDKIFKFQEMCCKVPESFTLHPGVKRVLSQRLELLKAGKLDWAMGEIAAISSLLADGIHVRLSGQDVERGTFSHRHHALHNTASKDEVYIPLNNLNLDRQAHYTVSNSALSEYGVLGFEHGYSMASPHFLTIWEGQFGDFSNTAQCIIDQFICSGEDKWVRQSGLVLLLPHGYDGMGPEHSSARLERFLQLTKEDPDKLPVYDPDTYEYNHIYDSNYIVANPTSPANLFHLLRRQFSFEFRKPLIVMSPKNLLRHEMARSSLEEFDQGTSFHRLISENGPCTSQPHLVKRIIFCSGKIYYELLKARSDKGLENHIALARIEQISPFPFDLASQEINKYPNAEIMYVQEEPKNQGAFFHVRPMLALLSNYEKNIAFSGRPVSASPATGSKYQHEIEQKDLLKRAMEF